MATVSDYRASRRWRLCVLLAGLVLAACDLSPLAGGETTADPRTPVETVTALEIDADDLRVDHPPAPHGGPSPH